MVLIKNIKHILTVNLFTQLLLISLFRKHNEFQFYSISKSEIFVIKTAGCPRKLVWHSEDYSDVQWQFCKTGPQVWATPQLVHRRIKGEPRG